MAAIAKLRREGKDHWYSRSVLAAQLHETPSRWLRDRMTAKELTDYLDVVESLIRDRRVEDDRIVLRRTDARGARGYLPDPNLLMRWVDKLAETVERQPESERSNS